MLCVPPTCHVSPAASAWAQPHHHTPIALQPAEQVVGGEIVVCVELGEELLAVPHEIDNILGGGAQRLLPLVTETMREVKQKVGLA